MIKNFGVSGGSSSVMSLAMGQRPDSELIDSASQKMASNIDVNGEKASAPTPPTPKQAEKESSVMGYMSGGLLGGGKGVGETANNLKGGAQDVMKFADDHPVIAQAVTVGAAVAFPPAAPAIYAGKKAIDAANLADNVAMNGAMKGGEEITQAQAQALAGQGRSMLEGKGSLSDVNSVWSQTQSADGLSERVAHTTQGLTNKQLNARRNTNTR